MLEIVDFEPKHIMGLWVQTAQEQFKPLLEDPEYRDAYDVPGLAFTAMRDGEPLGSAGILPQWRGRALAWALVSQKMRPRDWVIITPKVIEILDKAAAEGFWRIECVVDNSFFAGRRWMAHLGFEREGLMTAYSPEGRDSLLYARIRLPMNGAALPFRDPADEKRARQ